MNIEETLDRRARPRRYYISIHVSPVCMNVEVKKRSRVAPRWGCSYTPKLFYKRIFIFVFWLPVCVYQSICGKHIMHINIYIIQNILLDGIAIDNF